MRLEFDQNESVLKKAFEQEDYERKLSKEGHIMDNLKEGRMSFMQDASFLNERGIVDIPEDCKLTGYPDEDEEFSCGIKSSFNS